LDSLTVFILPVARIEKFEEIKAWQLARDLVRTISGFTQKDPFRKDWGLSDQIQRAAVSIMSNIAEGFGRSSSREFINFLHIARGSCSEVRSLLYVACDLKYISEQEQEFTQASRQAEEISKAISGLVRYLRSARCSS
jgi:four helix bundle protein